MSLITQRSPLFVDSDGGLDTLLRIYDEVETVATGEMGLSCYRNQIEIITAEQMLDAYAASGMPVMYRHWSFGKRFALQEAAYRKGKQGLAYEIVINSDPCVVYVMEQNTMAMQALVMAHAGFGHNHFFKNNGLFQQWTDARSIVDYLAYAQGYVARCEEKHGLKAVEATLDAAHALRDQGVDRVKRSRLLSLKDEERRRRERQADAERAYDDLWRTVPPGAEKAKAEKKQGELLRAMVLPEENLLLFIEKYAPKLKPWQREIVRIVRLTAQYFYPQGQTKVMNEGCATFVHYQILNRLYDKGLLTEGSVLECLKSHTNVVFQPGYDYERGYDGINPYALGFAMMQDIERMALHPTEEDREWFPLIAGSRDPMGVLREAWSAYRDESFIRQYLSPRLMRKWRLFLLDDNSSDSHMRVSDIHDEEGYRNVRNALAGSYDPSETTMNVQITGVDLAGDRALDLEYRIRDGKMLGAQCTAPVLKHVANLWGYRVALREIDEGGSEKKKHEAMPDKE